MPSLIENKLRVVATAAARNRLTTDRASLRDLASEIEWAKTTLATPDDYPAAREGRRPRAAVRGRRGRGRLRQLRDGQAARRGAGLRGPPAGHRVRDRGAPRRSPARCAAQYRHFVVDEYQDVNPLQQRLLDAWLGGRAEVCVVGDPNQTIYSFTGADPDYLLGFADRYADAEVVKLERDYRSTPQVVGLANRLIGQAPLRKGLPGLRLLGQRPDAAEPTLRRAPRRAGRGGRGRGEVPGADRLRACRRPRSRCSSGSTPSRRCTSPRWPTSASRTCSRAASASSSGRRCARRCCCSAVPPPVAASPARWSPRSATCWPRPAGPSTARRPAARPATAGSRWPRWSTSPSTWSRRTRPSTCAGFVGHLAERANAQHAPTVQGVTLASMHAAKGLEWDVVFVVGLVDGMRPDRAVAAAGRTRSRRSGGCSTSRSPGPASS